jgi:hypothetical protein
MTDYWLESFCLSTTRIPFLSPTAKRRSDIVMVCVRPSVLVSINHLYSHKPYTTVQRRHKYTYNKYRCTKCDNITIGDEFHYIMECEHFSNFRNRFIVTNLRERPNILKLKQIMSAYQKQNLEKLCKFIRNINKYFVL